MELDEAAGVVQPPKVDLLELDEGLQRLARQDPRQARIVELRFFGGLTEDEVADVLGISIATVQREWRFAKAVLRSRIPPDRE